MGLMKVEISERRKRTQSREKGRKGTRDEGQGRILLEYGPMTCSLTARGTNDNRKLTKEKRWRRPWHHKRCEGKRNKVGKLYQDRWHEMPDTLMLRRGSGSQKFDQTTRHFRKGFLSVKHENGAEHQNGRVSVSARYISAEDGRRGLYWKNESNNRKRL